MTISADETGPAVDADSASSRRSVGAYALILLTIAVAVFGLTNLLPLLPYDLWWHMRVGQIILDTGRIPTVDAFSFTTYGAPYDNYAQFWLAEIALYRLYAAGGIGLLVLARALTCALACALVWLAARQRAGVAPATLATLFAVALGFTGFILRPQLFGVALGAALLLCLTQDLAGKRAAWLAPIPLIMLLWTNVHGTWTLGALLLAIWFAARGAAARRATQGLRAWLRLMAVPIAIGLLSFLAVLLNPRGVRIVPYALSIAADPVVQGYATEWMPATFREPVGAIYLTGFLLASLLLILSPKRPDVFETLVYLAFGFLGLKMIRGSIWFGLFMAPAVARHLDALVATRRIASRPPRVALRSPARRFLNAAVAILLLLAAAASTPWAREALNPGWSMDSLLGADTPVAATAALLKSDVGPNVFHDQRFGSYLIWAANPPHRVFLDARMELYTPELVEEYRAIADGLPGWEEKLVRRDVRALVLSPERQAALAKAVEDSGAWERIYADAGALVFTRRD